MAHKKIPPSAGPSILLKRVVLVGLGLAIGCALGEWACRHLFNKKLQELTFSEADLYYTTDPSGVRRHIPNKIGYERLWDNTGKAEFRINSLGLRGKEIETPKPANTFRIIFLGDSITLGGRLPEEATFVSRIARALQARPSAPTDGVNADVVNAGVGDTGLIEERQWLNDVGFKIQPDLVILCWYLNDNRPPVGFPEETVYKNPAIRWLNQQSWLRQSYLMGTLYGNLRQVLARHQIALMESRSRRFDWINAYNAGLWVKDPAEFQKLIEGAQFDWGDAWKDASLAAMCQKISAIRDSMSSHHARFAVVAFPEHAQVVTNVASPLISKPQDQLKEFCGSHQIPFFDLLPVLRSKQGQRLFYDNCHYTPGGNSVVAELITEFLKGKNLLF